MTIFLSKKVKLLAVTVTAGVCASYGLNQIIPYEGHDGWSWECTYSHLIVWSLIFRFFGCTSTEGHDLNTIGFILWISCLSPWLFFYNPINIMPLIQFILIHVLGVI